MLLEAGRCQKFGELTGVVAFARDVIGAATNAVSAVVDEAQECTHQLTALGLDVVTVTVTTAHDALTEAAAGLGDAHVANGSAVTVLGEAGSGIRIQDPAGLLKSS